MANKTWKRENPRERERKEHHDEINVTVERKTDEISKGRNSLRIDKDDLMRELLEQPTLTQDWADSLAVAKGEMDRLEGVLELVKAEVLIEAKNDPESFGLPDKPSVDLIKAAVPRSNRYQKAQQEYNEARVEVGRLGAMVSAIDAKKKSLQLIVSLVLSGLYADVKIPKGQRESLSRELGRKQANEIAFD